MKVIEPSTDKMTITYTTGGKLREIDLAQKSCRVFESANSYITCFFDDKLEAEVKAALGMFVEVTGQGKLLMSEGNSVGIREMKLEKIDVVEPRFGDPTVFRPMPIKEFLESELVGMWADRTDIDDTDEFAHRLRYEPIVGVVEPDNDRNHS